MDEACCASNTTRATQNGDLVVSVHFVVDVEPDPALTIQIAHFRRPLTLVNLSDWLNRRLRRRGCLMPSGHSLGTQIRRMAAAGLVLFSLVAIAAAIGVHPATASGSSTGEGIAGWAAHENGVAYCDGGGGYDGPTLQTSGSVCSAPGYSCMSLAMFAVYQATGVEIPQANANDTYPNGYPGTWIQPLSTEADDVDSLDPGDAVFFGGAMNNYAHTGIYAGNGEVWDAGTSTTVNPTGKVALTKFRNLSRSTVYLIIREPWTTAPSR